MSSTTTTNSGDEDNVVYSSTVHKAIIYSNGGAFGLLQFVTSQSWSPIKGAPSRGSITILFFLVFFLIYVVLGVCEVQLLNKPPFRKFVGHVSHLFGVLAALLLISLIAPIFALIVLPLGLGWFFFVMYRSFSQLKENNSETPVQLSA